MKPVIVLAMHGAPPNDFPRREAMELFSLHSRLEHAAESERATLARRHEELEAKMRAWPRTPENDPFHAGSMELANELSCATCMEVILGFNEFCAPSLDEAFDLAANRGAERVIVVTPMMTRGGEHSEVDIPTAVERARDRYPRIAIDYIWPLDMVQVALFLASQIWQCSEKEALYETRTA